MFSVFLNRDSARHDGPVGTRWVLLNLGLPGGVQALRSVQNLHEATATAGYARRLCDLFGFSIQHATRYTELPQWPQATTVDSIQSHLYYLVMAVSTSVDLGTLSRIGRALADPTRQRVLLALLDGPGYPAELADSFGTSRGNLSNHLTCLRECGLVTATLEGRRVRYELADDHLADALRALASLQLPGACDT